MQAGAKKPAKVSLGGLFAAPPAVLARESRQPTMKGSLEAFEAVLDGAGEDPAEPLRIRERRSVSGREQFIVTAFGTRAAYDAHAGEIDKWFETATFLPLGEKDPR